jgi:O-acetyl-ADP-ribose deacetylase (regulator of RNase III)
MRRWRRAIAAPLNSARPTTSFRLLFPAISTGVYRFPAERAARIAVAATASALTTAPVVRRVVFCCFSNDSARLHAQAMAEFGSPCAD